MFLYVSLVFACVHTHMNKKHTKQVYTHSLSLSMSRSIAFFLNRLIPYRDTVIKCSAFSPDYSVIIISLNKIKSMCKFNLVQ